MTDRANVVAIPPLAAVSGLVLGGALEWATPSHILPRAIASAIGTPRLRHKVACADVSRHIEERSVLIHAGDEEVAVCLIHQIVGQWPRDNRGTPFNIADTQSHRVAELGFGRLYFRFAFPAILVDDFPGDIGPGVDDFHGLACRDTDHARMESPREVYRDPRQTGV